jgi:hypothetical protein
VDALIEILGACSVALLAFELGWHRRSAQLSLASCSISSDDITQLITTEDELDQDKPEATIAPSVC